MKRLVLTALALLAGCAGPRPTAPLDTAVTAPSAWLQPVAQGGAIDAQWWKTFGDPALDQLVEKALRHNPDLAIAAQRVQESAALLQQSHAATQPSVDGVIGAARQRAVSATGRGLTQTGKQAQLSLSYELDLFGRLASADAAARAALQGNEAARDALRLSIAASVSEAYLGLCTLAARERLLNATLEARASARQLVQRRADAGYTAPLDAWQAEAEYQGAARLIPGMRLAMARQQDALSVLLGEAPHAFICKTDPLALQLPAVPPVLPAELLRQRPDIAQAEQAVVAADHALDVSRAAFMPRIQLSAARGFADADVLPMPVQTFSWGGSVLYPIFEGGRLRAQADAAAARRDQAAYAYRKAALNAFREVEDALAAVSLGAEQEAADERQKTALEHTLTLATRRYKAGYSPYLEQLDAQRQLFAAQLAAVQSRAERLSAQVALYKALGGGWQGASR
ncbi:efflux transporter outer membrane subunit [Chitinimonas sp.]|uniref:efflux transporter outer membrane subunit n=1 Tax=Chitinimonas sp. TaxID=1934313 RepID=UPI0035B3618F